MSVEMEQYKEKYLRLIDENRDFEKDLSDFYNTLLSYIVLIRALINNDCFQADEFTNELYSRYSLELIRIKLPSSLIMVLDEDLNKLDEILLDNTVLLNDSLLNVNDQGLLKYSLFCRAPKNRDEDFEDRIKGLIC